MKTPSQRCLGEMEENKKDNDELEKTENIDVDLIKQFKESLEDIKAGRIRRVA